MLTDIVVNLMSNTSYAHLQLTAVRLKMQTDSVSSMLKDKCNKWDVKTQ